MKALVLFSGGVDSSTCLGMAVSRYGAENVVALSVQYGQKHEKEVEAAEKIARYYNVELVRLDLTPIFAFSDCPLLKQSEQEIPRESYAEQIAATEGGPVSTYVPFRNGLFLSSAASVSLSKGCSVILYGAHSDDAAGSAYPDCSEAFNDAMAGRSMREVAVSFVSKRLLWECQRQTWFAPACPLRFRINIPGVAMKAANIPAAYALPASIGRGPLNSTE